MHGEREVAGLRCGAVLDRLGDFLDGELSPEEAAKIRAHLAGCTACERFGGAMGGLVGALRHELSSAEPLDPDVAERLRDRLRRDLG